MPAIDEKRFEALGQEWVARFDFNSICELEDRTGQSFFELVAPFLSGLDARDQDDAGKVMAAARAIRFKDMRLVMHQALLAKQPDTTITDTGEIIGDIGLEQAMEVVAWAIINGMPSRQEGAKGGAGDPPRKTARQTG